MRPYLRDPLNELLDNVECLIISAKTDFEKLIIIRKIQRVADDIAGIQPKD